MTAGGMPAPGRVPRTDEGVEEPVPGSEMPAMVREETSWPMTTKITRGRSIMLHRDFIGSIAQGVMHLAVLLAALLMTMGGARAFDESKYPDLKGQWDRTAPPRWLDHAHRP